MRIDGRCKAAARFSSQGRRDAEPEATTVLLWIIMAILAAAAALPVLVPLFRARPIQPMASAAGSIYRDQLAEIERDRGRGLIAESEAEAARTEVARRLLKTSEAAAQPATATTPLRQRAAAGAVIIMPLLALGLYVLLGSPELPDRPLAARLSLPIDKQDPEIIAAQLESRLAGHPDDATGWDFLAQIEASLEHYAEEARALGNLIRLRGASVELETAYGEALTRANDGVVTREARTAFEAGNKIDPQAIGPRFFLALALSQEGKRDDAVAAWHQLLIGAPADAPWAQMARQALVSLEAAPASPSSGGESGPSAADVQAAQNLSPDQRLAMISGMVSQLAQRLESDPNDAEGWARLVRSYMVLGRSADAKAALAKARTALAGKSDLLDRVEAEAKSVGVPQ
jgi:cytochrome c-type biogenesis protein CcmH